MDSSYDDPNYIPLYTLNGVGDAIVRVNMHNYLYIFLENGPN
jgi:hypothetical protein